MSGWIISAFTSLLFRPFLIEENLSIRISLDNRVDSNIQRHSMARL
jgi:hypothetical protein